MVSESVVQILFRGDVDLAGVSGVAFGDPVRSVFFRRRLVKVKPRARSA